MLIETGDVFFLAEPPPLHYVRMGFSSIPSKSIEPGIRVLGDVLAGMMAGR